MSRPAATASETATLSALYEHLVSIGRRVERVVRDTEDNPDAVFVVDSRRIAIECTQVPSDRVFKWVHTRFKQLQRGGARAVAIVWPVEPHSWVKEAIEKKRSKIPTYRENSSASEAWLLIHTPKSSREFVRGDSPTHQLLLIHGACLIAHDFERVFFFDSTGGVQQIYRRNQRPPDVRFDLDAGYPTCSALHGLAPFKTTEEGAPPVVYDYGVVEPDLIVVTPLDPEYQKREPAIRAKKYRQRIIAGAHDARMEFTPVETIRP